MIYKFYVIFWQIKVISFFRLMFVSHERFEFQLIFIERAKGNLIGGKTSEIHASLGVPVVEDSVSLDLQLAVVLALEVVWVKCSKHDQAENDVSVIFRLSKPFRPSTLKM